METLEAIFTRRSVREYLDKKISKENIHILLKAAMSAPSANDTQPWQFVVIEEKEILEKIPKFSPYAKMCPFAPLSILVCGDLDLSYGDYWPQDCSSSIQNMLLSAHALGLGAVWTGAYPNKDKMQGFTNLLKLPKNIVPLGLIVIGYPKNTPTKRNNFKEERVHYNSW